MSDTKRLFSTQSLKKIAIVNYIALLIYMPVWLILISPSTMSPWLTIVMFVVPLLLPARGIFTGNPYTYAWANFILMIYFLHSLTTLWVVPEDRVWAAIELVITTILFLSATYYAKYRGQELGLSIRKKKSEDNSDKK